MNSRLDALQAAILRVKLRHLENWTKGREDRANRYRTLFEGTKAAEFVQLPPVPRAELRHVYNQFCVRCKDRDGLQQFLQRQGIPTEIYYPIPLHLQNAFSYLGYSAGQIPHSEKASLEVLALPVFPELPEARQDAVVQAIADFYSSKN
jgi:dTDP-4-amino-4,6-dideoxygalactose transaminase